MLPTKPSWAPYTGTAYVQHSSNMQRTPKKYITKWNQVRSTKGLQTNPAALAPNCITGPIQFVLKLLEDWHLSREDSVRLLGFDQTDATHVSDVLNGLDQFRGRDVRDRIAHLFHIRGTLSSLWQNLGVEKTSYANRIRCLRSNHRWICCWVVRWKIFYWCGNMSMRRWEGDVTFCGVLYP